MRRILSLLFAGACALVVTQRDAGAINWGEPDVNDQHPYTVQLATIIPETDPVLAEFCSGVLLDSTHVLTAAHCVDYPGSITFVSEGLQGFPGIVSVALLPLNNSHMHPDFTQVGVGPDIAVLTLLGPVPIIPAELPSSEYFELISRGAAADRTFTTSGYGTQGVSALSTDSGDPFEYFGIRQLAEQILLSINQGVGSNEYVQLSNAKGIGGGPCLGDSGGPVIAPNTDIVVAINSGGTTENCAGMSLSSRVDIPYVLEFIEERLNH